MVANTVLLRNGNGEPVLFKTEYDVSANAHSSAVSASLNVVASAITSNTISIPANTHTQLVANNASRKFLTIQNIGANLATLGFGANAVANSGYFMYANAILTFNTSNFVPSQSVYAYSTLGTSLTILEG